MAIRKERWWVAPRLSVYCPGLLFAVAVGWCPVHSSQASERYALLVGVGHYAEAGIRPLEGPVPDVTALRELLVSRLGYRPENVRTLVDQDARKSDILGALDVLIGVSDDRSDPPTRPGDHVLFYYSGHGTSGQARRYAAPLPYGTGALVPFDATLAGSDQQRLERLIIGRRDLRPRLQLADERGIRVLAVFDSCYSGEAVRSWHLASGRTEHASAHQPAATRMAPMPWIGETIDLSVEEQREAYPYRNVFFIAASGEREEAWDLNSTKMHMYPTFGNQPHGALTDALLRALNGELTSAMDVDGVISYGSLFDSVRDFMAARGYPHTPRHLPVSFEDVHQLRLQAFANASAGNITEGSGRLRVGLAVPGLDPATTQALQAAVSSVSELGTEPVDLVVTSASGRYVVLRSGGDVVGSDLSLETIPEVLRREAWVRELLGQAPANSLDLSLEEIERGSQGGYYAEGESLRFGLRASEPAYFLVVSIDPLGVIDVLHPSAGESPATVRKLVIPGRSNSPIEIRCAPPEYACGSEVLVAVAFREPSAALAVVAGSARLEPRSQGYAEVTNLLRSPQAAARKPLLIFTGPAPVALREESADAE